MKMQALLLPIAIFTLACQHPEVEAFRQHPAPLVVNLSLPQGLPSAAEIRQDYGAALRARLATRVVVVPEGVAAPPGAVELEVVVRRLEAGQGHSDPSPAAVGVTTGVAVGVLSAVSGHRGGSILDGLFWGLWAGSNAANAARHEHRHLGFYPARVQALVTLKGTATGQGGRAPILSEFEISGHEVVDAMDPLSYTDSGDPDRVREQEARAFARVVTAKLQARFGWATQPAPTFYSSESKAESAQSAAKPEGKRP